MSLDSKIQVYLSQNSIEYAPGDYLTGIPDGEEDQVLEWNTAKLGAQPTQEQLDSAFQTHVAAIQAVAYKAKRAAEYPSIGDQLDALWKGGAAAEAMLAQVQAVKKNYPKGV